METGSLKRGKGFARDDEDHRASIANKSAAFINLMLMEKLTCMELLNNLLVKPAAALAVQKE